jgi:hypothetical protein
MSSEYVLLNYEQKRKAGLMDWMFCQIDKPDLPQLFDFKFEH